jgi:hypothetical protein
MISSMTAAPAPAVRAQILDVVGIQKLLPHRPPFLLVDRVVAFEHGKRLVAWKSVTMNEPFFAGDVGRAARSPEGRGGRRVTCACPFRGNSHD